MSDNISVIKGHKNLVKQKGKSSISMIEGDSNEVVQESNEGSSKLISWGKMIALLSSLAAFLHYLVTDYDKFLKFFKRLF
jgi:hypothetical protein